MAYRNSNDAKLLQVVSLDEKTKDWTAPVQISTDPVYDEFECKFAADGTAYLAYYVLEEKTDGISNYTLQNMPIQTSYCGIILNQPYPD